VARWDRAALRVVIPLFLASRLWLIVASGIAAHLTWPAILSRPTTMPFWQTWRQWDADLYAHIATVGYLPAEAHTTPAFFPFFPLLERLGAPLWGGNPYLAGLLITNLAWFVALYQIFRLASEDFSPTIAQGTVAALTFFPTAFFGFVPYPEALFLALAIAALRQIRHHHWLAAGLLGGLAALTRQAGLLLIVPYLWEWITSKPLRGPGPITPPPHPRMKRICLDDVHMRALLPVLLIPTGTTLYALWLWHVVGDPLAFVHAQGTWQRVFAWPWQTLWLGVHALGTQPSRYFTWRAWQELLTVLAMGGLLLAGLKRLPTTYLVFALPLYLLFLTQLDPAWPLLSQSRFLLEVFPLFIVLGEAIAAHRRVLIILAAIGIPLQMILVGIFSRGGWII
jgi:hypothetical protein